MEFVFKELKDRYFGKKYCSICKECCHWNEKYIFEDDGVIELYDGKLSMCISPNTLAKLYYCSNCINLFPEKLTFDLYPVSWSTYFFDNNGEEEDIDYYGTVEHCNYLNESNFSFYGTNNCCYY